MYSAQVGFLFSEFLFHRCYELSFDEVVELRVKQNKEGETFAKSATLSQVAGRINHILKEHFASKWGIECHSPRSESAIEALLKHDFFVRSFEDSEDGFLSPVLHINYSEKNGVSGGMHQTLSFKDIKKLLFAIPTQPTVGTPRSRHRSIEPGNSPFSPRNSPREKGSERVLSPVEKMVLNQLDTKILEMVNSVLDQVWDEKKSDWEKLTQ